MGKVLTSAGYCQD